jgi:Raf kinase inhibitor-like YbhB/YbcL family protein
MVMNKEVPMMMLSSHSYDDNDTIPTKHAHNSVVGGRNVSLELIWSDPPVTTKSFALSMIDLHPGANNWIHWLVINIPLRERKIVEGASRTNSLPPGAKELMNSFNELGYGGPAPPKRSGVHAYVATLHALNVEALDLGVQSSYRQFVKAIEGKVIEEATLTGKYERK